MTDQYRRSTIATLRLAFASSLVLELIATLSVALVAVSVGLRLLDSQLTFRTALFVLVLAPEAYLPLRQVGANFHASVEGMAAAEQVFAVLAVDDGPRGVRTDVPDPSSHAIEVSGLTVAYPGRGEPALAGVSLVVEPGRILALAGPSGCGKSTLLGVLLGFVRPTVGSGARRRGGPERAGPGRLARPGRVGPAARRTCSPARWTSNVRAGRPDAAAADVLEAVASAGLGPLVAALPDGLQTRLGERGAGLSAGERQRVALARAFLRDAPLLLLDEPTAGLDAGTEAEVLEAVRRLAAGRTVVLVAHRPGLLTLADQVVQLDRPWRCRRDDRADLTGAPDAAAGPRPVLAGFGSALLGAGAVVSAVGLMATSAWLISRAAQHPSVQALAVAVVAIRFFALAGRCCATPSGWSGTTRPCGCWPTCGSGSTSGWNGWPRPAWRRSAAAICCPGWWPTSTRSRTCCCAFSRRTWWRSWPAPQWCC